MKAWLKDSNGNKCSVEWFGSQEAAQKALDSLKNCENCTNCSGCSRCSRCSGCSGCSGCSHVAWLYNKKSLQGDPDAAPGANGPPPTPVIENIHQTIYAAASQPESLDMITWHTCKNTHCWAGWVVTKAGEEGKRLEAFFDTPLAAMKILDASSPLRVSPVRFFEANDDALAAMKALAEAEATPAGSRPVEVV